MTTGDLILRLAADVGPVRQRAVEMRIAAGIGIGVLASIVVVGIALGVRPDFGEAIRGRSFWLKLVYTLSLAAVALVLTSELARPGTRRLGRAWLAALPVVTLAMFALSELSQNPSADWSRMWLGESWRSCMGLVLSLSLPIFAGLLWSFRRLAPTRLRAAGAAAGLTAGSLAATVYCLHCPEVTALFVLTWYSLGVLLSTLLGMLLGPRLLRW